MQLTESFIPQAPSFLILQEGIVRNGASDQPIVTFPQEETLFGRDVTIDALYISLYADVPQGTDIQFYFNGSLFSTITLDPATFNNLDGNPVELKVFPTNANGTGVFTSHSPQLQIR